MQTTFLNAAGTVLFVRDDMEQGNWTQEEYSVNATFPYVAGKVIERGQRIAFRDPATDTLEMFEIRNVTNIEPEHYQQIVAEHIAVSELSDEHINTAEITDKTAAQALTTALTGTLWSVGNSTASGTQSADISRGSVWQAVLAVQQNWNVYITPRVTVNAAGSITGRYLDIAPAEGTWRGVRLSIDKNMEDSSVEYDDSEVLTALYGYGGSVDVPQASGDDTTEELTFADVVWSATSAHPAKPAGQTYLEDPAKTALYGRNGRPRYGYYQNGNIKDANTLLEKTWEALKQTSSPKISITGTVADLYRLGYTDQPLRLHDTVIVEIRQTGELFQKEIIKLDVDLIDPTATRPTVGDYIPNIVYINRDTNEKATGGGGGGGGGGGRGLTNLEEDKINTYAEFERDHDKIGMVVGTYDGVNKIKAGEIVLSINGQTGQSIAKISANVVDISGIITAINNESGTHLIIGADDVQISGTSLYLNDVLSVDGYGSSANLSHATIGILDGVSSFSATEATVVDLETTQLTVGNSSGGGNIATWQTQPVVTGVSTSGSHYFLYTSDTSSQTPSGSASGMLVSSVSTETLHYLGYANT